MKLTIYTVIVFLLICNNMQAQEEVFIHILHGRVLNYGLGYACLTRTWSCSV